ncbi:MAG: hypothetical protein QXS32_08430 [Candidatus Nezhaarchaeales archaeon]
MSSEAPGPAIRALPVPQPSMTVINNLFMAALLWAARNNCQCQACIRLKKVAELMEKSLEAVE